MYFVLSYEVVEDYLTRRAEFRDEHLALAQAYTERGELVLAGAKGDPITGALLIFEASSEEVAISFAQADPYVKHGLVTQWQVQPWHVVIGRDLSNPVL